MGAVDIVIIAAYMILMLVLGIYAGKKQKNTEDYFLAGKNADVFSVACLWLSSWIGGASIVGTAERAFDMGVTAVWYVLIIAVSLVIFALSFIRMIKRLSERFDLTTYPDFIEQRYDSRTRLVASICTILGMTGFVASQFLAGGAILSALTGWNAKTSLIIVAVVITFYTAFGGLLAVTYTDWFQTLILLVGIVVLGVPACYAKLDGGLQAFQALPEGYFDLGSWGWLSIAGLGVSTLFSFYTNMDNYTRCIAAKDEKVSMKGAMIAAAGIFFVAVSATFLGMCAKIIVPEATGANALAYLIVDIFPSGLRGILLIGIIAAIMSSADICMLTASTSLAKDVYRRYIRPQVSDQELQKVTIGCSFAIGVIAVLITLNSQNIIDVLFIALTINSAGLFLPTVFGMFWEKANSHAAFLSTLCSLLAILFWFAGGTMGWGGVFRMDPLWPGVLISAVLFFPLSIWKEQTPEEKQKVRDFMKQ
ncbi:MAG: sodium:solute symporter family protein [Lachnospiraceae bacterium]